ncbi:hypothetical protein Tco_1394989 [Tanacetum coccineum]
MPSVVTAAIISAVCQANDHGLGVIRVPKQKRNTGTKEIEILPPLPFSSAATFANIMCRLPLPPPLSPPSTKLMIMALEEYGYQSRRGIRVPKKWRSSYSGDVIFLKKVMKVLEMNEEGLRCLIWMILLKCLMTSWLMVARMILRNIEGLHR